jgi:hypothetical protein
MCLSLRPGILVKPPCPLGAPPCMKMLISLSPPRERVRVRGQHESIFVLKGTNKNVTYYLF